jgi:hypothetical protein
MNTELTTLLAKLRLVVGYLGERDQFGWWQSSFFAQGSNAFLSPIFSKTQLLAQGTGVTRAASLLHDERIGVGSVYHLFRLPEDMEQNIHRVLHEPAIEKDIRNLIVSQNTALEFLSMRAVDSKSVTGPYLAGKLNSIREKTIWNQITNLYFAGFSNGHEIFPYFSDRSL